MAKRPKKQRPSPTVGQELQGAMEDFFNAPNMGGAAHTSKGLGSTDPRHDDPFADPGDPEIVGWDANDNPIIKPKSLPGLPSKVGLDPEAIDNSGIARALGLHPDSGEPPGEVGDMSKELEQFSPQQIQLLLENIFGPKGNKAALNDMVDSLLGGRGVAPRFPGQAAPGPMPRSPMAMAQRGTLQRKPLIDVSGNNMQPRNPLIDLPDFLNQGRGPLIDLPADKRKRLLAAMAQLQHEAHGLHLVK